MTSETNGGRRIIPFGSHWAMGIEVPYSLGIIDRGRLWSCGQCPLDLQAKLLRPGDLAGQLRLVAGLIREQFAPYGVPSRRIGKVVAYTVADGRTSLEQAGAILGEELPGVGAIVVIGVPHFYYAGMMVEIDVHGSTEAEPAARSVTLAPGVEASIVTCGSGGHAAVSFAPHAPTGGWLASLQRNPGAVTGLASARIFVTPEAAASSRLRQVAAELGADPGMAVVASLPHGQALAADLILEGGEHPQTAGALRHGDVLVVERRAGPFLSIMGRIAGAPRSLADAARAIMEAFRARLSAAGLDFASVVKQQAFYVGGASEDDLYANMRVRNSYYERPGPASTGLAVEGFADRECRITIELIAAERS
jgi:enamine deaminase RidA (YjgF/YER057c/UK114 family)